MKYNSKTIMTALVLAGVVGLGGAGMAHAATTTDTSPHDRLATVLAERFNLNKDEVVKVLETTRDQMHSEMKAKHAEYVKNKLAELVTAGKLTQAQSDALSAKLQEIETKREANRNSETTLSKAARREAMKSEMESFKVWATANGISKDILQEIHNRGHEGAPDKK